MVAGDPPEADGQTAATDRVMGKSSDLSFMVHRGFIFEGVEGSILKSPNGSAPRRANEELGRGSKPRITRMDPNRDPDRDRDRDRKINNLEKELNRVSEMLRCRGTERDKKAEDLKEWGKEHGWTGWTGFGMRNWGEGANHGLHGWARIPLRPNRASQCYAGQEATAGQVGPQS